MSDLSVMPIARVTGPYMEDEHHEELEVRAPLKVVEDTPTVVSPEAHDMWVCRMKGLATSNVRNSCLHFDDESQMKDSHLEAGCGWHRLQGV